MSAPFLVADVLEDVVAYAACDGAPALLLLRGVSRGFHAAVSGSLRNRLAAVNELEGILQTPLNDGAKLGPLMRHAADRSAARVPCSAAELARVAAIEEDDRSAEAGGGMALNLFPSLPTHMDRSCLPAAGTTSAFFRLLTLAVLPHARCIYSHSATFLTEVLAFAAASTTTPPAAVPLAHVGMLDGGDLATVRALRRLRCPVVKLSFSCAVSEEVLAEMLEWDPPTLAQIEVEAGYGGYGADNPDDAMGTQYFASVADVADAHTNGGMAPRRDLVWAECSRAAQLARVCERSATTLRSLTLELPNSDDAHAAFAAIPPQVVELLLYENEDDDDEDDDEDADEDEDERPNATFSLASYLALGHALPAALLHLDAFEQSNADIEALLATPVGTNLQLLHIHQRAPLDTAPIVCSVAGKCRWLRHLGFTCAGDSAVAGAVISAIAAGLQFLETLELSRSSHEDAPRSAGRISNDHLVALACGCTGLRSVSVDAWPFDDVAAAFEAAAAATQRSFGSLTRLSVWFRGREDGPFDSDAARTVALRLVGAVPSLRVLADLAGPGDAPWGADALAVMRRNNGGKPCAV